jgi:catechol 2,3-dioxygenase-like lactoylglutathione lyase family enzyme
MLDRSPLAVNLKAPDLDEALAFYERLGLRLRERRSLMPGHEEVRIDARGAVLCIERGEGGRLPYEPITFEVEDLASTLAALGERGIEPEDYDLPSIKTVDGIASFGAIRAAWLKDPAGNLIGLVEPAPASA